MKNKWDYSTLADAYLKRPDYAYAAIDAMLSIASAEKNGEFCDVGAGRSHATLNRKAGATFYDAFAVIETDLQSLGEPSIQIS